jgi:hypothetical protein
MGLPSKFHVYQDGVWVNLLRDFLPTDPAEGTGGTVTTYTEDGYLPGPHVRYVG